MVKSECPDATLNNTRAGPSGFRNLFQVFKVARPDAYERRKPMRFK